MSEDAFGTHVLREVHQRQDKEHVLLAVQQRTVPEVAVVPAVAEGELRGEGLELSGDVSPGLRLGRLPADPQGPADAGPVDLFQELGANQERGRDGENGEERERLREGVVEGEA